jgi:HlyD family secretion protein
MKKLSSIIALIVVLLVVSGVTGASFVLVKPEPYYLQGEIEATKVNVSAKVPGRVEEFRAPEGGKVAKGDVVAVLDSPQLQAKKEQATGARNAAAAQSEKAQNGAREEEIRMANNRWLQAKAGRELAEVSFARVQRLFNDGVVPAQKRDEVEAQLKMARELESMAKAGYDMAQNGARDEDKTAAAALVDQASGAVAEVDSLLEEAQGRAPISGEVNEHVVEAGELASSGMPIMTIVDLDDVWATFNIREDHFGGLKMGEKIQGMVPALKNAPVELEVTYIAALGDFARWRATSATGGFDLKTFEVHAKPARKLEGLRPGMSVVVPWER